MSTDEAEIVDFLRQNPGIWFSRRELSRKVKRREDFEENPHWANAPLHSLLIQKILIQNDQGHYLLQEEEEKKKYLW